MSETLLTMGMPVHNEEKYIAEAIESLLAQTYKDFILIISDNASTDRTQQICEYYAKRDKRIVYVRHKENKGSMFNFRYVLEQTNTPFFMWCGGHDKWEPLFAGELLSEFKKEDIILSYPKSRLINMNGELGRVYKDDYTTTNIDKPVDRYLYLLRSIKIGNLFYGIWSTKALKSCNFDIKTIAGDNIILEQAAIEGKFKQCNKILFLRRENRKPGNHSDKIKRQFSGSYGKKQNEFLSAMAYILASIKVPLSRNYSFNIFTKIWLIINIVYYKFFGWYIMSAFKMIFKKIAGEKIYFKLKSIKDNNGFNK
jgi:glycosyltransferase involved in cell wall biosynthesis